MSGNQILFFPDYADPNDQAGWSMMLSGHSLEHGQFLNYIPQNIKTGMGAGVLFDFGLWPDKDDPDYQSMLDQWIGTHDAVHQALGSGIGLGDLDVNDPSNWQIWLSAHATEHQRLRTLFGIQPP